MAEIQWIQFPRNEIDGDSFLEEYRGFEIYFAIPNGGILGAGIREKKGRGKCWLFDSTCLEGDFYLDDEFHLKKCRDKIDEILEKRAKRKPRKKKSKQEKAEQLTLNLGV